MGTRLDGTSIALARIAEEAERRTGVLDLSGLELDQLPEELFHLLHLRMLDLGRAKDSERYARNRIDAQRKRLGRLTDLLALDVSETDLTDLTALAGLTHLQQLDCSDTQVTDLTPLAGLTNLQQLKCSYTRVTDLTPLAGLTDLQQLACADTQVSDLTPLAGLAVLKKLDCSINAITDLTPLAGLNALQQLDCSITQVTDLTPLAGLVVLQQLDCYHTEVIDLTPLTGLTALQQFDCHNTQITDLTPLVRLTDLQQLNCSFTQISDLTPLAGLTSLQEFDCRRTGVADLTPLAGLTDLQKLSCTETQISDLTPLAGLTDLQMLYCSGCRLEALPEQIRNRASLRHLSLFHTHVPGLPQEVLSGSLGENCLHKVRAHFADLELESAFLSDVRLLLLGNGRVGKTQVARWLKHAPFDRDWNSTHGIEVGGADLPGEHGTRLQIWDFGGQDIYHSTHALFLRSPAVLALVWAADEEKVGSYEHDGLTFRNQPLTYWVELIRHLAAPDSPVLILQSKCDRPGQEVPVFPVPEEALRALRHRKLLHVSIKKRRGLAALSEALSEAVEWLRDPQRLGLPQIGAGRLRVQRRLEALRDADMALPREQRRHRWLERQAFETICAEEGGVTDPAMLLAYLDANGTVFHRPGLFGDRIVLDQGWALEAIYALFDRKRVYRELRRDRGRFTRSRLAFLIWREHSEAEQGLLLGMMQACGICFVHRRLADGEVEYIAPDLLPERAEIAAALAERWADERPHEEAMFHHALLHGGLIRAVMSAIGEQAGAEPLYWRGGLCGYEATTRSRLLIEEETTGLWQGAIRIRTQGGQAADLLQRLVTLVEKAQAQLGMRPTTVERTSPTIGERDEAPMTFKQEKPDRPEWYVSYAWGDDRTAEGKEREKIVDDLCAAAEARGQPIIRDKNVLGLGDSISAFMRRIGQGDRIFVILSDKYLKSSNCMFELTQIWLTSRREESILLDRVRVYTVGDADIWDPVARVKHAGYWRRKYEALEAAVREEGLGALADRDHAAYLHMREFYAQAGNILAAFADTVQPRSFDELVRYGFGDMQKAD